MSDPIRVTWKEENEGAWGPIYRETLVRDEMSLRALISAAEAALLDLTGPQEPVEEEPANPFISPFGIVDYARTLPMHTYWPPEERPHPLYPLVDKHKPTLGSERKIKAQEQMSGYALMEMINEQYRQITKAIQNTPGHTEVHTPTHYAPSRPSPSTPAVGEELGDSGRLRYQCSCCGGEKPIGHYDSQMGYCLLCWRDASFDSPTEQYASEAVSGEQSSAGYPVGEGALPLLDKQRRGKL